MPLRTRNIIRYVYLNADGDPQKAGAILAAFYDTEEKVERLLARGDLSRLHQNAMRCGLYNEAASTLAFAAGKGIEAFKRLQKEEIIDYGYLFINDKWMCWDRKGDEAAVPDK
jgi:hypothetical protein